MLKNKIEKVKLNRILEKFRPSYSIFSAVVVLGLCRVLYIFH